MKSVLRMKHAAVAAAGSRWSVILAGVVSIPWFAATPAVADVTFFTDQSAFEVFMLAQGQLVDGVEDFEEMRSVPVGRFDFMEPDPLDSATDNEYFSPGDILHSLRFQSNQFGDDPIAPFPDLGVGGTEPLALINNAFGTSSKAVVSNSGGSSLDMIILGDARTAIGFDVLSLQSSATVRVYGPGEVPLGSFVTPAPASGSFLGVFSDVPIGRINVSVVGGGQDGVDNVQLYDIPAPGAAVLLGVVGCAGWRPRHRRT